MEYLTNTTSAKVDQILNNVYAYYEWKGAKTLNSLICNWSKYFIHVFSESMKQTGDV